MLKSLNSIARPVIDSLPQPIKEAAENIRYFGLPVPIRTVRPYSMLSYINLFFLQELARRADALGLHGDFVECGVYRGGSAGVLGYEAMRSPANRNLWLYDAFAGMPAASKMDDDYSRSIQGQFVGSEAQTHRILHRLGVSENRYKIIRGWFEDTLPKADPRSVALLHVDCDFYDPVKLTLETFYPHIEANGFIILNDYGTFKGCRAATDEFLEKKGLEISSVIQIDQDAYYFQKLSPDGERETLSTSQPSGAHPE
jgi:O-methyltransferase